MHFGRDNGRKSKTFRVDKVRMSNLMYSKKPRKGFSLLHTFWGISLDAIGGIEKEATRAAG